MIPVLLWALACAPPPPPSPLIEGTVRDAFGRPLAGVKVHVLKSAYAAETQADGTYQVPYAPGAFQVSYRHRDHTTEIVDLDIQVATTFPSDDIVLYARPVDGRLDGLGADGPVRLAARQVKERLAFKGMRSVRSWSCPDEGPSLGRPGVDVRFADATDRHLRVARLSDQGLIEHDDRAPASTRYEGWRTSREDIVGQERITLRAFEPASPGDYAWVVVDDEGHPSKDDATCFPFRIEAERAEPDEAP